MLQLEHGRAFRGMKAGKLGPGDARLQQKRRCQMGNHLASKFDWISVR